MTDGTRARPAIPFRESEPLVPPHHHGRGRPGGGDGLPALARRSCGRRSRLRGELGVPHRVLGGGSNLVVVDEGLDELVVNTEAHARGGHPRGRRRHRRRRSQPDPHRREAAAAPAGGASRARCGIPGSVGGAAVMNAGAYGFSISDVMTDIVVYDENGERARAARGLALPLPRLLDSRGLGGGVDHGAAAAGRPRGAARGDARALAAALEEPARRPQRRLRLQEPRGTRRRAGSSTSSGSRARAGAARW